MDIRSFTCAFKRPIATMKKNETRLIMRSASLFALAFSVLSLGSLTGISASYAQDGGAVSAVGDDSLGNPATAVTPEESPFGDEPQVIDNTAAPVATTTKTTTTTVSTTAPAQPTAVAPTPVETPDVDSVSAVAQEPPQGQLPPAEEPQAKTSVTPLPADASGVAEGGNVMDPNGQTKKYSGQYFDANAVVPNRALSALPNAAPRMVDPKYEPGSRFIIANGTASAQSFEGQYVAATRAIKLQRYAAAMEMFEKLYKQESKDPRVLMGLAVAQQGAGFNESAAQTYEELLQVQPNNANAIVNLMGIMKNQYPSVTLNRLMELRQKYPNNAGIPAQIGLVSADLKNYDDSMRYLEIAASMEPSNPSHIYNMAIVADHQGNAPKAIQYYERALQMDASVTGTATESIPRDKIYDRLSVLRRKI